MGAVTEWVQRALNPKASTPNTGAQVIYSDGRVPIPNVDGLRYWARYSPWVRAAIDIRKNQIASADFEIGPYDIDRPYSKRLAKQIKAIFDRPNPVHRSFRAFITPVMDDLLTLDAGMIEAVGTLMEPVRYLYPVNAKWVRVAKGWDGTSPKSPRYFWYVNGNYSGRSWTNNEFAHMMQNPSTYSDIGIPALEVLRLTVQSELEGTEYNRRQVASAVPEGILHLGEGVPKEKVDEVRSFFAQEVLGKGAMAILGGGKEPKWFNMRQSNRDMQFDTLLRYYVTQIAVVFGLSIQDFQQLFDINRSTGETQAQLSEDRGLRPLADLIQDELTQQFVWHPSFGGPDNNLAFRFTRLKIKESYEKAQMNKIALAGVPWGTVNQALIDSGREPIGDINDAANTFNQRIANTPLGMVRLTENPEDIPTPAELLGLKSKTPEPTNGQSNGTKPATTPAPVTEGPSQEE